MMKHVFLRLNPSSYHVTCVTDSMKDLTQENISSLVTDEIENTKNIENHNSTSQKLTSYQNTANIDKPNITRNYEL